MTRKRKKFSSQFKFKVALEAVKGQQTLNEIASKHSVHPNQVSSWKKQLLHAGLADYFDLYNYERPHQSLGYQTPADVHHAVKMVV